MSKITFSYLGVISSLEFSYHIFWYWKATNNMYKIYNKTESTWLNPWQLCCTCYCYCRLNMYLKLFFVMGVNWIMEVISWAVGGPKYLWYIPDLGNILQGVLLFIIFVWKQRVRRMLVSKFCPQYAIRSGSQFHSRTKSQPTMSHLSSTVTHLQPLYPVMNRFRWNQLEHHILVMCLDQSSCQPAKSVHDIYSFDAITCKHFKH
jgi:hypothetical protein